MLSEQVTEQLLAALPPVRGRYLFEADLSKLTWFGVGGPAEILFKPKDLRDLCEFLSVNTHPVFTLGAGSNIIVRDGGIKGVTIRLTGPFAEIKIDGEFIEVGAGCLDRTVAMTCQQQGLSGLEFFISVPGTIGGALRMNAGAYGYETKDRLVWAEAVRPDGEVVQISASEMGMSYRHCGVPDDWIFTRALFHCERDTPENIQARLQDILEKRQATQPTKGRTGGSTFKNPGPLSAWKLIDEAGCRGMTLGDAIMSEKHCNFMLNMGNASAQDLEDLGERVRKTVKESTGVELQWEIKRVGEKLPPSLVNHDL